MQQVTQNYKTGAIRTQETTRPALKPGMLLVRTAYSVISTGTEGMKAREGKMSYLGKARARPDQAKKVIESVRQQGVAATYRKVMNRLDSLTPLGYSLAGTVLEVAPDVSGFHVGQPVACAGVGYANHAEINTVPLNLAVAVPEGVPLKQAAFATVGAIAMQGYRQAGMQLGESACVIGLGLIGQLLVQLLHAAGVQVLGVDLDSARCDLAVDCGASAAFVPGDPALHAASEAMTQGAGVDAVFLCAGGASNEPVELAAALARDRARVIDIGKTRLDLPWKEYYEKELDVRFSRSYGPGRYDPLYEERGIDYPIGYVRWTEARNMQAFLALLGKGQLRVDALISGVFPLADAERVYADLAEGRLQGTGVLFEYAPGAESATRPALAPTSAPAAPTAGTVRLGAIGAGNYACSMLLPHLQRNPGAQLVEVATTTSLSGANAARKFGFSRVSTDHAELLAAEDINAVVIATRHNSHADLTAEVLRSGKAVFVEKPLAIGLEGLEQVRQAIVEADNDRLLVGFNRRFAPLIRRLADAFASHSGPLAMQYRVHAGRKEAGSWYLDPEEGSRFVGEAGHFLDVFAFLCSAAPVSVYAAALSPPEPTADTRENVSLVVTYADGSTGSLQYLTQGGAKVPKESLEIFGGGRAAHLDDFSSLTLYDGARRSRHRGKVDKGQKEEMAAFVNAVANGTAMPIPVQSLIDTTLVTLAADRSLRTGKVEMLDSFWTAGGNMTAPEE